MTDKGWQGKGDKLLRRSPKKKGKMCGRPFSAPRTVRQTTAKTPKVVETKETEDSEVRVLTNREVEMIVSMQDIAPEAHEAQNDSSDSDENIPFSTLLRQEKEFQERPEIEVHSDTTGSTPDIKHDIKGHIKHDIKGHIKE